MTRYSKLNIVYRLQKWMDSVPGQTFLNYAYSWGASIVVLGALLKLIHIEGADLWLIFGMGTEVVVFFLSAFDRPFDKTTDGMELPTHLTDEYLTRTDEVSSNVKPSVTPQIQAQPMTTAAPAVAKTASLTEQVASIALTGITKVYEMQLKSASQQIGTIDQINEQSRLLARHIEQLNAIYARMIEAMTTNMRAAAPNQTPTL